MPRNLSAWIDLTIHLFVMLVLIGVLSYYNFYMAAIAFVVWIALASFARERCLDRSQRFDQYCRMVVSNVNKLQNYAIDMLPQAILVVSDDFRLQWSNERLQEFIGKKAEQETDIREFWPNIVLKPVWGTEGEYVFTHGDKYYQVKHRPVQISEDQSPLMALFVQDVSGVEHLRNEYLMSRIVLTYIQIDNYDEVTQGLKEAERTSLLLSVNQQLDAWTNSHNGFLCRVSKDLFLVVMERKMLDQAITERFDLLDKVRQLMGSNRLPVTLSIGTAVADTQSISELGAQAQSELDLALGRGGDQAAVLIGGKNQFFGGRAQAVEKHTRVRARVVAHAIREMMEGADEIYIMGHHNEDYDCFGAAMGVAKMATQLKKTVHILLSDMNDGIDKFTDLLKGNEEYEGLFMHENEILGTTALNPLLIVVDTHVPQLVAAPSLLNRISQTIIIDHHRRSENFIKNPLIVYIEPASSSTSELVTELLMYFDDKIRLSRLDATALYSGIVVDTKNFAVQTGVRTFDAAAYLRRCGADPVAVRHLFRSDYETTMALAKTEARSEYFDGGLIVSYIPDYLSNGQIIAAQAADSFLRIESVRMSIVCFQLKDNVVGISARSTGDLNVQVIMEHFGGGGHQNVAGAQIQNAALNEIRQQVIEVSRKYIEETDKNEGNLAAGH